MQTNQLPLCQALITNLRVYSLDSIGYSQHCDTSWGDWEYRYSFQGQEMDDEIKGEGNSINFEYRMHDPRIGRFFAIDPLIFDYPHYSPYSFSGNKVIHAIELEGMEEKIIIERVIPIKPVISVKSSEEIQHEYAIKIIEKHEIPKSDFSKKVDCNCPEGMAVEMAKGLISEHPDGVLSVRPIKYYEVPDGLGGYDQIFLWDVQYAYTDEDGTVTIRSVGRFEHDYGYSHTVSGGGVYYLDPDEEFEDLGSRQGRKVFKKTMKENTKANKQFNDVAKKMKLNKDDLYEFSDY